ncbi:hypothetical protein lerEdw1_017200 [Lerista edwardsae]|nr:hypothetical protein lerEdw1_017200 [Lerista edwardsae]
MLRRRIRKQPTLRNPIKQTESADDIPITGELQRILESGEYIPLTSAPVFESNFVQVNRRGESIYLHNRPNYVIMGICASNPALSLPNVMLLANSCPSSSQEDIPISSGLSEQSEDEIVLTRFLPLKFVDISVHSAKDRRLKLKLVSGRSYYLELCAPPQKRSQIFHQWLRLINLLKSTQSEVNFLPKDFDVRAKYRNKPSKMNADQGYNQLVPSMNEQDSHETVKAQIVKQSSSKRVTISDIVAPIEDFHKSQSQSTLSSYSFIRKLSVNSGKPTTTVSELKSITKTRSRYVDY